jgi:hypothetical protein
MKLLRSTAIISKLILSSSVSEPHNFYEAPARGKNFDAAPTALALSLSPTK